MLCAPVKCSAFTNKHNYYSLNFKHINYEVRTGRPNNNNIDNENLVHPTSGEPKALTKTTLHKRKQQPQRYSRQTQSITLLTYTK